MVNISYIHNLHQGNRNVRALDETIKSEYKDYTNRKYQSFPAKYEHVQFFT